MKQIPLLQGKALLIELPEGANSAQDSHANGFIYKLPDGYVESWYADEDGGLDGNWRLIGMLSEVTEEQAAEIVSKVINGQHFQNYAFTSPVNRWVKTALESLESAIQAQGWYFENPYGEEEPTIDDPDPHSQYFGAQMDLVVEWNHKQPRVLDRSRCLLLGREI